MIPRLKLLSYYLLLPLLVFWLWPPVAADNTTISVTSTMNNETKFCRHNVTILDCSNVTPALTTIPTNLPNGTNSLRMSGNDLSNARWNELTPIDALIILDLSDTGLNDSLVSSLDITRIAPKLEELFLNHNKIEIISWEKCFLASQMSNQCTNHIVVKLDLSANLITNISTGAMDHFPQLTFLNLTGNLLEYIPRKWQNLSNLKKLNLDSNRIFFIDAIAFQDMPSLRVLSLKHNRLTVIYPPGPFFIHREFGLTDLDLHGNKIAVANRDLSYGLDYLEKLHLGGNPIHTITNGNDFTNFWKGMHNLKKLYLSGKHLGPIRPELFSPMLAKLELLHLSKITAIQDDETTFAEFKSLKRLTLKGSPLPGLSQKLLEPLKKLNSLVLDSSLNLTCCHLMWLPEWVRSLEGEKFNLTVYCKTPGMLQNENRSIDYFALPQLKKNCSDMTQIVNISMSIQVWNRQKNLKLNAVDWLEVANSTRDFHIECAVNITVPLKDEKEHLTKINWRLNFTRTEPVNLPPNKTRVHLEYYRENIADNKSQTMRMEHTSMIILSEVMIEDAGQYRCDVQRDPASQVVKKSELQIVTYTKPEFVPAVRNLSLITANVDESVALSCEANAFPEAKISFDYSPSRESFLFNVSNVASTARKLEWHKEKRLDYDGRHIITIKRVIPSDAGWYMCVANNRYGVTRHIFQLVVHSSHSPVSFNASLLHLAVHGSSLNITCPFYGPFSGQIRWYHNGKLCNQSTISEDQTVLKLTQLTSMQHDGRWICELVSLSGDSQIVNGSFWLQVIPQPSSPNSALQTILDWFHRHVILITILAAIIVFILLVIITIIYIFPKLDLTKHKKKFSLKDALKASKVFESDFVFTLPPKSNILSTEEENIIMTKLSDLDTMSCSEVSSEQTTSSVVAEIHPQEETFSGNLFDYLPPAPLTTFKPALQDLPESIV